MTFVQVLNLVVLPIFIGLVLCIYGTPGPRISALFLLIAGSLIFYISHVAASQGYSTAEAMLFIAPGRFYAINGSLAYGMILLGLAGIGKRSLLRRRSDPGPGRQDYKSRAEYE